MKNTKLFVTLLVIAVSLVIAAAVYAGGPPPGWCSECCASEYGKRGQCTGCSCGGGGDGDIVIYIRPQDKIGEYYEDEDGTRHHTSFRTWSGCMEHFNDAILCSRIVTDSCESCMGLCKYSAGDTACNDTCKNACLNRPVYETEGQKELPGGEDTYGIYHYEKGRKIYDGLTDLDACLFMMGDMNRCVTTWGYDCRYGESFYVYEMCIDNYENDCFDRVKSEYADACK